MGAVGGLLAAGAAFLVGLILAAVATLHFARGGSRAQSEPGAGIEALPQTRNPKTKKRVQSVDILPQKQFASISVESTRLWGLVGLLDRRHAECRYCGSGVYSEVACLPGSGDNVTSSSWNLRETAPAGDYCLHLGLLFSHSAASAG